MAPRADENDEDDLSSGEDDDGFKEDMEALARACMIAGTNPDGIKPSSTVAPDDDYNADAVVPKASDPLLGPGDALVPVSDSDDEQRDLQYLKRVQELYQPSSFKPLKILPALSLSDDDEDDMETLRAIMRRFSAYERGPDEDNVDKMAEGAHTSGLGSEEEFDNSVASKGLDPGESCPVSQDAIKTTSLLTTAEVERHPCNINERCEPKACKPSKLLDKRSRFPLSAQVFIDAIKKNRSFQKLLRSKLIQMEAKIQENKQLRERVKLLKDFQVSCIRRTGQAISLKKDPRILLISAKKSTASSTTKINDKKISPMCYGPAENAHVAKYRMVLERSPFSLDRKKWSSVERENLAKGIKQQFQEILLQMSINQDSSEWSCGYANNFDNMLVSIKDLEITPENIRKFLPEFNWDQLASKYVTGRTGAECEARWLNCEDPLINHSPWTCEEDKLLLHIIQEIGNRDWFKIAALLNTNRTPFQCLARYQRSLNPAMLNSEWTEEEDAQLCYAVSIFGVSNWQSVASVLERRTGTQCSNRWKKSLCPDRKGSFTAEEDERLTVAVHLFGRKWNQIAKFVPGRTQAQCRDRYVNSLDPSLKWGGWTKEEDSRLKKAIAKHGFFWSKVAADVPPRTDSQCRKRWRVLCPDQVPMLQEARKMQKSALISNFVDRESERPCLSLNDFLPLAMIDPPPDPDAVSLPQKRKSKSSNASKKKRPQKRAKKAQSCLKKAQVDKVEPCSGHGVHKPKIIGSHLEDNSVEAVYDHSPLDSVVMTTNYQEDLGTTDGQSEKISSMNPSKHQTGRNSMLSANISDGAAVGRKVARNTTSKKERKKTGKRNGMVSVETAEDHLVKYKMPKPGSISSMQILESQDEDNITLARFIRNISNKQFKNTDQMTQAASYASSFVKKSRRSRRAAKRTCDYMPFSLKKGHELLSEEVRHGHDRNQEMSFMQDKNLDEGCIDVTPGTLLVHNHSSNLKNMSIIEADDNGKAMSELVCEQTMFLDGAMEPKNIGENVPTDVTLASFLKKKKIKKGKAISEPVDEQAIDLNFLTEAENTRGGEDGSLNVTLASLLKKKGRREGRTTKRSIRPS
ncbi:uncharacterized protein LOC129300810 isoform X2 [Prosopis cineraria]|uniref:uncharacterized protein LOC129300810 isoform X2 n=1 Tax=Prosopis cineraria TaxID=364024 RepID=UPI00240F4BC1|nr:uncharacterized protein LOC129300810 isoform X2 [Prosopis cineraria]